MALVNNWGKFGASILVGVVTTNCVPMFAVTVVALFKQVNCCCLVKSAYKAVKPTNHHGFTRHTVARA